MAMSDTSTDLDKNGGESKKKHVCEAMEIKNRAKHMDTIHMKQNEDYMYDMPKLMGLFYHFVCTFTEMYDVNWLTP